MSGGPALREGQVIGVTVARAHEEGAVDIIPASFVRDLFKKAGLIATDLAGIGWAGDDMPSPPPDFIGRQATIEKLAVLIRSAQPGDCFVLHGIPASARRRSPRTWLGCLTSSPTSKGVCTGSA
jgi:hypothetical protein